MARKMDFADQIEKIIEAASKAGADTNLLYLTTLDRYKTQISIMEKLKVSIGQDGPTVTKEYVKGRKNIVINPAITEYNKTASAANNTAQTLLKIVQSLDMNSIMELEVEEDEL
ncbi:MAG TPA: hypothetical protein IAC15_02170 [Candidatus Onthomonas avicola]|nr:hypothetical protein [Candidatus Onthomonas avicola]